MFSKPPMDSVPSLIALVRVESLQSLATMSRLYAARSFDVAGKRVEAVAQYRAVLARPDIYDSHDKAKRGLTEPFRLKDKEKKVSE